MKTTSRISILSAVAAGLLLPGTLPAGESAPAAINEITVVTENTGPVRVTQSRVTRDARGVLLRGEVKKRRGHSPGLGSHLHIELQNAKGDTLKEQLVEHLPRLLPANHRRVNPHAHFSTRWSSLPPDTARVVIRTHGWKTKKCRSLKN